MTSKAAEKKKIRERFGRVDPRVTVLLPVHNGEKYLGEAVRSVWGQSYRDFELLIIDDGSTDGTSGVLDALQAELKSGFTDGKIRVLRSSERRGISRSLNLGLRQARGELILRMDADDVSLPDRFAEQVARLDADPDTALVSCLFWFIDHRGQRLRPFKRPSLHPAWIAWNLLFRNYLGGHGQVAFRRQTALELGGYDESIPFSQDYDLWLRLLNCGKAQIIPQVLFLRRLHGDAASSRMKAEQRKASLANSRRALQALTRRDFSDDEIELCRRLLAGAWERERALPAPGRIAAVDECLRLAWRPFARAKSPSEMNVIRREIAVRYFALAARFLREVHLTPAARCLWRGLRWAPEGTVRAWLRRKYVARGFWARAAQAMDSTENPPPVLWITGDSTTFNHALDEVLTSWGEVFPRFFDPRRVAVRVEARSGNSIRDFVHRRTWAWLSRQMKPGDILVTAHGHCESAPLTREEDGRSRGSLPGDGGRVETVYDPYFKRHEEVRTFGWYLRKFIADCGERGVTMVILTPTCRNVWENGQVRRGRSLEYARSSREIAEETGTRFLDIGEAMARELNARGERASQRFFADNDIHTNQAGAEFVAALTLRLLRERFPEIFDGLILPRTADMASDTRGTAPRRLVEVCPRDGQG